MTRTNDLTCEELVDVLTDYFERALTVPDRIRVEQHLVVCSDCARYTEQMRAAIRLTAMLPLDEFSPERISELLAAVASRRPGPA